MKKFDRSGIGVRDRIRGEHANDEGRGALVQEWGGSRAYIAVALCLVAMLFLINGAAAETPQDARALVEKAEEAKKEGDTLAAVEKYTEAISALRLKAGPVDELASYTDRRDKLLSTLLFQFSEINKRKTELISIQNDIAKKLNDITRIDRDVQKKVTENERRLKDIEAELLRVLR